MRNTFERKLPFEYLDATLRQDTGQYENAVQSVAAAIRWQAFDYYPVLDRVRLHLLGNLTVRLSLEQAAAVAAMEPTYFSKYFRRTTGVTFRFWRDFCAVQHALECFRTIDISITEAANRSGFEDLGTFERAFRRIVGVAPREFRKHCRRLVHH